MDSLTQIVLGAACGEVVLGKKAGNRAMLWGGIAGTIPDLDILAYLFTDDMTALAFHRGITHSLFFAFSAPILFGWLVAKFYKSGFYQNRTYKAIAMSIWILLFGGIAFGVNSVASEKGVNWILLIMSVASVLLLMTFLWRRYFQTDLSEVNVTPKEWMWLFFWAILTHPLLDSCTAFGTQLYQPFSDYRVAWNTISVADPAYTVPFLICLVIAGFLTRQSPRRKWVNYLGIGISSGYLLFTIYNKNRVDKLFEQSLAAENIPYTRYTVSPTILNNILWNGVAETDSFYYQSFYSFFDDTPRFVDFKKEAKNHHLIKGHENDRSIRILKWFSNDYYSIIRRKDGRLQLNDMRYGSRSGQYQSDDDYIFKFLLEEKNGVLEATEQRKPPKAGELAKYFQRIGGKKISSTE